MVNWYHIPPDEKLRPFTFIVGGRGIGKTYSAIDAGITRHENALLYLRNTKEQIEESCGIFGNPFKKWAADHDRDIQLIKDKNHALIAEFITANQKTTKRIIGAGAALSVFSNLRGVDMSNIDLILFDEFIENRSLTFNQYDAFLHMYETVNRNRELTGQPPVKCLLLSNAQRLGNPILRGFNLIPVIENMQKTGQRSYANGSIRIELPFSEVSEAKRQTALYQATTGSDFNSEALDNNFINDSFTGIKRVNIQEYNPIVCIDDIYIYRHKSDPVYYACSIPAPVKKYRSRDNFIIFYRLYGLRFKMAYGADQFYFSDYSTKVDILNLLKMLY
jgi:hypothetical protein